jgi:hypothetical protein
MRRLAFEVISQSSEQSRKPGKKERREINNA